MPPAVQMTVMQKFVLHQATLALPTYAILGVNVAR